jgi:hypothetical protein
MDVHTSFPWRSGDLLHVELCGSSRLPACQAGKRAGGGYTGHPLACVRALA